MAFQDRALEKHFCPGNWERKICWGSEGGRETTPPEPPAGAGSRGLQLEVSPQPLEFHRNVWSKPILRQEGRSRTAEEGGQSRQEGGTCPWAQGNWGNTLASCWFWFPKVVFDSRDCNWTGALSGSVQKQFWAHSVCTRTDPSMLQLQVKHLVTVYSGKKIYGFLPFHLLIHCF